MTPDPKNRLGPSQRSESGVSIGALVIGIVAFSMVWIPIVGLTSWFTGSLGLLLGLVGLSKGGSKAFAIAGLALSALALCVCMMWWSATGATVQLH